MVKIKLTMTVCAYCKKVIKDIPEKYKGNPDVIIEISHGACQECFDKEVEELKRTIREE